MIFFAGFSHLFWAREEFQAQVPQWVPMDADGVVMASGGVEITLGIGLALLATRPGPRRLPPWRCSSC